MITRWAYLHLEGFSVELAVTFVFYDREQTWQSSRNEPEKHTMKLYEMDLLIYS